MNELDEKKALVEKLRSEIQEAEKNEDHKRRYPTMKLAEGFWKYRNCYSSPKTEKDYWWIYRRLSNVTPDGMMDLLDIQIDSDGHLRVQPRNRVSWHFQMNYNHDNFDHSWTRSSPQEWVDTYKKAQEILNLAV